MLTRAPRFEVLGQATNGIQAISMIKRHQPDVALLDLTMPGANGLEVFAEAQRWSPQTRSIVLTGTVRPALLEELERANVGGLLLKSASQDELHATIEKVAAGEQHISQSAAALYRNNDGGRRLSPREFEVLHAIARGMSTPQIADFLNISPKTVDSHRTNLLTKMNVHSTVALIVAAMREGIIDLGMESRQDD
jgi:DNA-binding NarL/FixJ family response regulator